MELVEGLAAERESAEDPPPAMDRHADEPLDLLTPDRGPGARQDVRVIVVLLDPDCLARDGHVADEPFADGQRPVHLAQARGHSALGPELEHPTVLGEEMEARDLVTGDARECVDRGA